MIGYVDDLRATVAQVSTRLLAVPESDAARQPAPGKWSSKEIIGHLIDSAANNHLRFVRAQFTTDLVSPGYPQEDFVRVQRYQEAPWAELVTLWRDYNLHLARVIEAMPEDVRQRERREHNLDQIAWQPVPREIPVTLDYFMGDYVAHLHHHLRQVEAALGTAFSERAASSSG
jgi:DinB family protein